MKKFLSVCLNQKGTWVSEKEMIEFLETGSMEEVKEVKGDLEAEEEILVEEAIIDGMFS